MVSALFLVSTLAFQAAPPAGSNGFFPSTPSDVKPPETKITPEMRGDIYMARKMYREAIEIYKAGAKDSAVLANKAGIGYHQLLDYDNAQKYYSLAIKLKPDYAEAINNLGTIFYAHKSYRRAVSQYKRALRVQPDSASILSNLGTAYFSRRNYDLAFETYQKALQLDPEVFEHKSSMGILLQERSVVERAKYHYYVAKTYAKLGMADQALMYIRKSLEEGFKERDKYKADPEFASLRENPEFKLLLATEYRVL
jgi:tetratricopeptide (TPR) repeat protein